MDGSYTLYLYQIKYILKRKTSGHFGYKSVCKYVCECNVCMLVCVCVVCAKRLVVRNQIKTTQTLEIETQIKLTENDKKNK